MKNTNSVSSFNHLNDAYASDKKKILHSNISKYSSQ